MTINPNEGNKKLELHLRIHTPTQLHWIALRPDTMLGTREPIKN